MSRFYGGVDNWGRRQILCDVTYIDDNITKKFTCTRRQKDCARNIVENEEKCASHFRNLLVGYRRFGFALKNTSFLGSDLSTRFTETSFSVSIRIGTRAPHRLLRPLIKVGIVVVTCQSNESRTPGVNFTNILHAAFTLIDPESIKIQFSHQYLFTLSGSACIKAVHRTLMKLRSSNNGYFGITFYILNFGLFKLRIIQTSDYSNFGLFGFWII